MNKQSGPIKIEATLGDITYYKRKGVYMVKRKSAVSRHRLKYSPQYAAFRQHQQDFGQASSGGKLIRSAFAPLVNSIADWTVCPRLTSRVLHVIKSDLAHPPGTRNMLPDHLELLKGFEFNAECSLSQVLMAPFSFSSDATNGTLRLEIPSFVAARHLRSPQHSSHFQLVLGVASMDFSMCRYQSVVAETGQMPVNSAAAQRISLNAQLSGTGADPQMVVLGVRFSQYINGVYEPVQNAGYQALRIVEIIVPGNLFGSMNTDPSAGASFDDRASGNGTTGGRAAENGTAGDGTARVGTARDGTVSDGTVRDGTVRDGTIRDGTARDSIAGVGTLGDGTTGIDTLHPLTLDCHPDNGPPWPPKPLA